MITYATPKYNVVQRRLAVLAAIFEIDRPTRDACHPSKGAGLQPREGARDISESFFYSFKRSLK